MSTADDYTDYEAVPWDSTELDGIAIKVENDQAVVKATTKLAKNKAALPKDWYPARERSWRMVMSLGTEDVKQELRQQLLFTLREIGEDANKRILTSQQGYEMLIACGLSDNDIVSVIVPSQFDYQAEVFFELRSGVRTLVKRLNYHKGVFLHEGRAYLISVLDVDAPAWIGFHIPYVGISQKRASVLEALERAAPTAGWSEWKDVVLAGQVVEVGATFKAKANWAVLLYKYMRRIPVEVGHTATFAHWSQTCSRCGCEEHDGICLAGAVAAEMFALKAASIAKWASPPPRDGSAATASKKRKVDAKPIKADIASKAKGTLPRKKSTPKEAEGGL